MGQCPGCNGKVGPIAIVASWNSWGKFICPGCGEWIQFRGWFLTVIVLSVLMITAERILHAMLTSQVPLWLSFLVSFTIGWLVMFFVPMIWKYDKTE